MPYINTFLILLSFTPILSISIIEYKKGMLLLRIQKGIILNTIGMLIMPKDIAKLAPNVTIYC